MARVLAEKMEELALALADKSLGNLPPDRELVDAFKCLTQYLLGTEKLGKGEDEEGTTNSSGFDGIKHRIAAAGREAA